MKITITTTGMASMEVGHFDLAKTLECGQCFRWQKNRDGSYTGIVQGRIITARQTENQLLLHPASRDEVEKIWVPYFDLERDYSTFNRRILRRAPWMKTPVSLGAGIRILKQDPWETAITFIFSANNHIPRITASVACLAKTWGTYLGEGAGGAYYGFPTPERLQQLSLEDWRRCGAGYRATYLSKTTEQWESHYREMMKARVSRKELPEHHRRMLEKLPGVGPKVSSCINLYGLGHHKQFPVDVWIRRRVKALWPGAPESDCAIERSAVELFGEAAGYAQQLLFYEARAK